MDATTRARQPLHTYCVRAQAVSVSRNVHTLRTIRTVAIRARTYSQARWWGVKMLRWQQVPFVRVSLRREPDHERPLDSEAV